MRCGKQCAAQRRWAALSRASTRQSARGVTHYILKGNNFGELVSRAHADRSARRELRSGVCNDYCAANLTRRERREKFIDMPRANATRCRSAAGPLLIRRPFIKITSSRCNKRTASPRMIRATRRFEIVDFNINYLEEMYGMENRWIQHPI